MDPITFKLSAPLTTHKGEVNELQLRMPKASSFARHGMPYEVKGEDIKLNMPAIFGFVADMTDIEVALLNTMEGCDVIPLAWAVVGVIGTRPKIGSTS